MATDDEGDEALEARYYRRHVSKENLARHPETASKYPLPDDVTALHDKRPGRRYMFRPGQLIVREADVDNELEELLRRREAVRYAFDPAAGERRTEREQARIDAAQRSLQRSGFVAYKLTDPLARRVEEDVPAIVEDLRTPGQHSRTWDVWPHVVLGVTQDAEYGPGKPPVTAPAFTREELEGFRDGAGAGIRVAVIDTGIRQDHLLLKEHCEILDANDLELLDEDKPIGVRDFVAGHGTAVAGVVRQHAPGASIIVRGTVRANGTVSDAEVAGAIDELVALDRIHILNLSLGGYAHDGEQTGLPCTEAALQRLRRAHENIVIVAAAGNDGLTEEFFPAALPYVLSVGAADDDGHPADFSNEGAWIKCWARGVDIRSSYVGPDIKSPGGGPKDRDSAVRWSGSSFAAPALAGFIAACMSPGS